MTIQKTHNITAAILFHQKRIADHKIYLAKLLEEKQHHVTDESRFREYEELEEATRQRIKENQEIIRVLSTA